MQTGILRTADEDYVIEPHSEMMPLQKGATESQQAHIMYKRSTIAQNTPHFYDSQTCEHLHKIGITVSFLFFSTDFDCLAIMTQLHLF